MHASLSYSPSKEAEPITIEIGTTFDGISALQLPGPFDGLGLVAWTGDSDRKAIVSYEKSMQVVQIYDPNIPHKLKFPMKNELGEIILGSQIVFTLTRVP